MTKDLEERFWQFKEMKLPGQPQSMHVGTASLVDDLWREIRRLREQAEHESRLHPSLPGD